MSKPAIYSYTHYPGFFVQDGTTGQDLPPLNNDGKAQGFEYKVFFVGRHGLSAHNITMMKYPGSGTKPSDKDWYTYWSNRYTDGVLTWGRYYAAAAVNSVWVKELQAGIGLPQTMYSSPLTRTLCTHTLTFNGLDGYDPKNNVVVEDLREWCGTQTPELRQSKSYIQEMFTSFSIEPGFSEDDPIWDPVFPETGTDLQNRIIAVLDDVFSHHDGPFVSLTTHGGLAEGLCRVIGRSVYNLKPAGVMPIVVRKSAVDALPKESMKPGTYTIRSVSNPDHIMCLANANGQTIIPDDSIIAVEAINAICHWDVSAASDGRHYIRVHGPPTQLSIPKTPLSALVGVNDQSVQLFIPKTPLGALVGAHDQSVQLSVPKTPLGDLVGLNGQSVHMSIQLSPRGDFAAHINILKDEPEPEYAIESDGMGRFRIINPSTGLVYTYTGHRKQVRLAHEVVDNDAHKWYFDAV